MAECPVCASKGPANCYVHQGLAKELGAIGRYLDVSPDNWAPTDDDAPDAPPRAQRHLRSVPAGAAAPDLTPEVLPLAEAPFTDWDSGFLPAPVRAWVDACHATLGVPKVMAIAAALCAAATLCQGKLRVRIRPGWDEPVNLYWLVLAPTGARKSALLKLATDPVRALQAQLDEENEPLAHEARCDLKRAEAQHARLIRQTKAHKHTAGYQEHLEQVRELEAEIRSIRIPKSPRWLCDDINPTVIPKVLKHNLEAEGLARLSVLDAEGTFLSNLLGRHDKRGSANVDPLLKAFQGEPVDMVRTSQTSDDLVRVHLPHSYVTMCLLVQPMFRDRLVNRPELAENGFIGRCIVTETPSRAADPGWDAPGIPDEVQEAYSDWVLSYATLPQDSLVDLAADAGLQEELRGLYGTVTGLRQLDEGCDGWLARGIGKICRIYALLHAHSPGTVELSNCHGVTGGGGGRAQETPLLTYLFKLIITGTYARTQALEPPSGGVSHLARRLLGALPRLRQLDSWTGPDLTLRTVTRALRIQREQASEVCEELCATGHLEQLDVKQNRNRTVTAKYRVITLDPAGRTPGKPLAVPSPPPEQASRASRDFIGDDLT